ncbi:ABC-type multidrug transport system, ATPase component [gamma proteobacterium HdN1]|nr:ABC-type multidrug transport system, ATPase component [gamma proteobacterium HdN1]
MLDGIKKLYALLTKEQRRQYFLYQLVFVLNAALQTAGVASIAPFIVLLTNQDYIQSNAILHWIYNYLEFTSSTTFLIFFACVVIATIVASNAVAALSTWLIFKFSLGFGTSVQDSLFKYYASQDTVYHSRKNSAEIISAITQETPRMTYMVIQPILFLVGQLFVVLLISSGLLYVDFWLAVSAALIIGGGYLFVYKITRDRLHMHGQKVWDANNYRIKILNECFGGFKEVKLIGNESAYQKRVHNENMKMLYSSSVIGLMADTPKFVIETIALCAIMVLAVYLLYTTNSPEKVMTILSLYAMAGYKLLPAAQTVFKSMASIRGNILVVTELYPYATAGQKADLTHPTTQPLEVKNRAITLRNVSYAYPQTQRNALDCINLRFAPNTITAFVGTSGSGKSTLADLLLGLLSASQGELLIGDQVVNDDNRRAWQLNLGYVPQNIFLSDETIAKNIAFGEDAGAIAKDRLIAAAKAASLHHFIQTLEHQYDNPVGERGGLLSGGQRQRVGIARALYRNANILILDEATSALDNVTEHAIAETIQQLRAGKIIVMIAHRLTTIKNADQVVYMEGGKVVAAGTYNELVKTCAEFRNLLAKGEA